MYNNYPKGCVDCVYFDKGSDGINTLEEYEEPQEPYCCEPHMLEIAESGQDDLSIILNVLMLELSNREACPFRRARPRKSLRDIRKLRRAYRSVGIEEVSRKELPSWLDEFPQASRKEVIIKYRVDRGAGEKEKTGTGYLYPEENTVKMFLENGGFLRWTVTDETVRKLMKEEIPQFNPDSDEFLTFRLENETKT